MKQRPPEGPPPGREPGREGPGRPIPSPVVGPGTGMPNPGLKELTARWALLRRWAAPVLSPLGLALTLGLVVSLLVSWFFQFVTGLFEAFPVLNGLWTLLNIGLAIAASVAIVIRRRWSRPIVLVLVALVGVVLLSLGALGARFQYQRGLAGNPFYTLPHYAMAYPKEATEVSIQTTDGVQLFGTQVGARRQKAVVIYPSWRATRDSFAIATMALWLSNSFDVLVIDPRGQGKSGGVKTPNGDAKHDLIAAVSFLKSSGYQRVGVLSEQDGAYPAVLAAGLHQGIDSLAIAAPSRHWGESLGQEGRLWDPSGPFGRLYWRSTAGLRLAGGPEGTPLRQALATVTPTPILLAIPRRDLGLQVNQLHEAAGEPKSLMVLEGDGRPTDWAHFAEYFKSVEQWFNLSLATTYETAPAAPVEEEPVATPE